MTSPIYNQLKEKYEGKKVLVVGLGLLGGGLGVVQFFSQLGAYVIVSDKKSEGQLLPSIEKLKKFKNIDYHLGGHYKDDFNNADIIFKGPSVPWDLTEIIAAQKKGVPIEMELSFVVKNFPGKVIGVTGTRGKSTTTYLIYHLLKKLKINVLLGGGLPNISTINYLKIAEKSDWLVVELSSWSLSAFHKKKLSPKIAVFTSFYPDHLNYYKSLDEYFYDKAAIFLYQKKEDYLIANKSLKDLVKRYPVSSQINYCTKEDFPYHLKYLPGDHNLENASFALKVIEVLRLNREKAVKIIRNFSGLPFRLQKIKEKNNVVFINDSTSTTPIATIKAIDSFSRKKIVLLLGGNSKNLPYDELIKRLKEVEKIVLLEGSFTKEILPILKEKYQEKLIGPFDNLKPAVEKAYQIGLGLKDAVVLFSPGATSFSMFNNEFDRGESFNKIVYNLQLLS